MTKEYVFGYGSLVNRATHAFTECHPAEVDGWRRVWRHVEGRSVAFLTVTPSDGTTINGLIARVDAPDWPALDLRERSYLRISADGVRHAAGADARIQIYHAPDHLHRPATTRHPILLSYLDAVVAGYLREFGIASVARFFDTTDGWDAPILDDRSAPIYPRHQPLDPDQRALVDREIIRVGAPVTRDAARTPVTDP